MKSLLNDLAIIVPTYNRHDYLNRVASFYSDFDINVYVLDSTPSEAHLIFPSNVHYKWVPQLNFSQKILFQVEELSDIPYIALVADDDFVKYETLVECYDVMFENSNYVMANGAQFLFNQSFNKRLYYNIYANGFKGRNEIKNDEAGISFYWKNYQNILWSLYKRDILHKAFFNLTKCNFNSGNFPELLVSIEVLRSGYVYISDKPFNFMEINPNEHWGTTSPSITWTSYWTNPSLKKDIKKFKSFFNKDEHALKCIKLNMGTPHAVLFKLVFQKFKGILRRFCTPFRRNRVEEDWMLSVCDDIMIERLSNVFDKVGK